jgi:two-component system cell cycle response regulator
MRSAPSVKREAGKRRVRVLLVEEDPAGPSGLGDAMAKLGDAGVELESVPDLNRALERLSQGGIDLLLLDLDLPDSEDLGSFERVHAFAPDVPIVVLTGMEDEDMALDMVKSGAQDYLVKGDVGPDVLLRSIRYAVERHHLASALRSLSLIDDLTGLYNRRGFSDLGEQHLKLARRTARAVLLVYVDVDDLKTINDTLGHQTGDRALVRVADILRETFRQSDIIARIGGDEFAVMALEASEENETHLLQRLKARIREVNQENGEPYDLSVSVGAARFPVEGTPRLIDLLAQVDEAMYQEKWSKKRGMRGKSTPQGTTIDP